MEWGKRTDRISCVRSTGQQECLAAAPAKVLAAPLATAARFGHPVLATKLVEGSRLSPDPLERVSLHMFEFDPGNHTGGVARKSTTRRIDQYQSPCPSAHAGLGIARVIIRHNIIDPHLSAQPLLRLRDHSYGLFHLPSCGQKEITVGQCPSVVLHVG